MWNGVTEGEGGGGGRRGRACHPGLLPQSEMRARGGSWAEEWHILTLVCPLLVLKVPRSGLQGQVPRSSGKAPMPGGKRSREEEEQGPESLGCPWTLGRAGWVGPREEGHWATAGEPRPPFAS